jgi:hypothetical protein
MLARCTGSEGGPVRALLALSACLAVSFILLIVAGAVGHNWLPMINLGAVVLVPISVILSDTFGGSAFAASYDEGRAAWANFGSCFFGTLLVSLFGLPLVLYHVGSVSAASVAAAVAKHARVSEHRSTGQRAKARGSSAVRVVHGWVYIVCRYAPSACPASMVNWLPTPCTSLPLSTLVLCCLFSCP